MFSNAIRLCSQIVTIINMLRPLLSFQMTASVANASLISNKMFMLPQHFLPLPTASAQMSTLR